MPRLRRIHIEEGLYFITTRGDHGGELFRDDKDREEYLELLARYREELGFKLLAYVLMPNFVHLLIEMAPETTISEVMHVINSTYTKYFNGRYEKHGHLFQGRFRAVVVEKDGQAAELTRLIHLVPVAGRLAAGPEDYKWSSYHLYLEAKNDAEEVLKRFSGVPEEQMKLYREFMSQAKKDELETLRKKTERSVILGSKEFVERMKKRLKEETKEGKGEGAPLRIGGVPVSPRFYKVFAVAGSLAIIVLSVFTIYLYATSLRVVNRVEDMFQERDAELKKDLQEKYRGDLVSYYHAMVRRLERERKRSEKGEENG